MVTSLITRVEASHLDGRFDHVAMVSLAHKVTLLVVECVVLVLALVVQAAAGSYCCWRGCCRDTATRECCLGFLPRCEGASENSIMTDSECSVRRRLREATLRDELRIALWRRRGLPASWKEVLIKRLMRGHGVWALTEEAAAALLFVRRRSCSRSGGLALTDDAGAIGWIVQAFTEKSVHNGGRGAISDVRTSEHQAERP